jgi:uncharacterized protein (TIGR02246 family)
MKKAEEEVLALENRYWQAIKHKDVATALELTADPCIVTGPQGVRSVSKQEFSEMMETADYDLVDYELGDIEVRMLDPDTAVLAYRVHEQYTVEGEPITIDAHDSSTWTRRDGSWVCALHTESIAGDPWGRDRVATA